MLSIAFTDEWRRTFPGAVIGLLEISGVDNAHPSPGLEERKRETEARLRAACQGFARKDFLSLPVMAAYDRYYGRFRKTYHVLLQLESIVLKGKSLPGVSPLVDSNFVSEVETFVLTAGHDAACLADPVQVDASREGEQIMQMSGTPRTMHAGDMVMRDAHGVSCSIIYGQDDRSPISTGTSRVLYVAYGPPGVPSEAVDLQLRGIEANVRTCSAGAVLEQRRLVQA
jgi:DNA/RNA-binding domain of Phe-tRNA-synthetase-like protein